MGRRSRIQSMLATLEDDDRMTYLRNWRELIEENMKTCTLKGVTLVPLDDSTVAESPELVGSRQYRRPHVWTSPSN